MSAKSGQRRQRILLLLGSGLVALVLAETCLWLLDIPRNIASFRFLGNVFDEADVFEEDPDLFWRMRPDTSRYRVNDLGLRGPPVPVEKGPRDLRIACFGDSCTFGSHVRLEDTWGWLLQERLQKRLPNRRVQAILAALPGYSSYQSLALFRKHIAPRKPDITVLYVGGYNDYVPAIGESDGERGARLQAEHNSLWRRWRLVRLCARILAPKPKLSRAEYVAAFERGEAPDGRRVPVADLQENMEALIREAKEVGSKVLVLVPPLPADTLQKHRVALEYRAVVRYVTRRSGDEPVDPTAAFAGRAVQQEFNLPEHQRAYWPCFVDWVHPSVLGHHLVADWLQQALRNDNFRLTPAPDCMAFGNLEPRSVVGGRKSHVIATEDNNRWGADTASRAMVGRWWVPDWEPVFGAQASVSVRLDLPPTIPPGTYRVRLITDLGVTTCPAPLVVEPPPLTAEISRKGNTLTLRFQITGPKGWPVGVWVSTDKRRVPAPTRFGPFHLVANPDGRPAGFRHDTPFMFLRLELPQVAGTIPADGTWRHEVEVDLDKLGTVPDQIHAQGLMHRDEAHGILTDVVTLAVPR